jgi:hypothetical protein
MFKPKENKDVKIVRDAIPHWESRLDDLRQEMNLAQKRFNDYVNPKIQEQLADIRPVGIPTEAGKKLPVAPFVVLDLDPKRQEMEDNIQRLRAEVNIVEDKLQRFRAFVEKNTK